MLKKEGNTFLNNLEGYRQLLKELHWNTTCHARHTLTDDICDSIQDYEDKIAENLMGNGSFRYGVGDLTTMRPSSKNLADMLKELQSDADQFKGKLDEKKHAGIINILDDLSEDVNKWKYLETFN